MAIYLWWASMGTNLKVNLLYRSEQFSDEYPIIAMRKTASKTGMGLRQVLLLRKKGNQSSCSRFAKSIIALLILLPCKERSFRAKRQHRKESAPDSRRTESLDTSRWPCKTRCPRPRSMPRGSENPWGWRAHSRLKNNHEKKRKFSSRFFFFLPIGPRFGSSKWPL